MGHLFFMYFLILPDYLSRFGWRYRVSTRLVERSTAELPWVKYWVELMGYEVMGIRTDRG